MPIEGQKQLLQEICSEYDLPVVLTALVELHGADAVRDALPLADAWEVASGKALADELIAACQQPQN